MALLESVPNVSEGRDQAAIDAIGKAFAAHGRVLDVHSDIDHHRSVYTIVADERVLAESLLAGIARAAELIDLRRHDGVHPRIGAADVVPIVPLRAGQMELAVEVALALGRRVGDELGLPVFLYGACGDGAARRSSAAEARPSCSGGLTRASCSRRSGRRDSIPRPAVS